MNNRLKGFFTHFILITVSILSIFPFLWLISTALKGQSENIFQYPPQFIPKFPTWDNFVGVWKQIPFVLYFVNSLITAAFTVVLNVVFSALAAYPLARMNFKGKNLIFYLILATIMVPFQAIMLPIYLIILKLNLVDTVSKVAGYAGLILPFAVNAFGIFLMRQAFLAVPKELEEAAFVDGCNILQIWRKVLLPCTAPTCAVLAVFTFIGSWGEFLWPSIVLTDKTLYTLPVGINDLQGMFSANWRYIAAGSIISIIPIIIFFLAMQKYFISGHNDGAVKG